MADIDPISCMVVGIAFSILGIVLLWSKPRKYKAIGTACAVIGVIISIGNLSQFVEIGSYLVPSAEQTNP